MELNHMLHCSTTIILSILRMNMEDGSTAESSNNFTAYADVCFREFGNHVKFWTTINEANIFTTGGYNDVVTPPGRCSSSPGRNCSSGNSSTEPYIKEVAEERSKEAEVKLAVREGKKEVAEAYGKILVCVKEKFARKKDEVDALVYAQELQANADLLKDMLNNKIQSVEEEYNQLVALLPEATTAYEKAQVSDFSVSKLPLPQISESSGTFEINMFNPSFSGEYGSNLGLMAPDLAPVEAASGGVNAGAVLARGVWKAGSCPSAPGLSGEKFRRSLGKEGSANRSWKVTPLPWWTDGWVVAD
uniref:thioglucosidase n=1 Tax=Brassica oleracea var. oleracea TaxID=109376 RepID=A0A0D3BKW3_BRAOL